ncbi:uncharacterized protein LY89DRAFT_682771 [Mollisia scopiformis]|uniref:Uncharacterized protein n=1 Tax=Mollisia scopiformis TaxID=149040 RepID=A0A194XIF7_MOLSC|nr:uncharacterized protein LY89DRAFT_682771 [Mollisia scopiformis]KUJ19943.1 hypothetical protein LY89DRAFT_682771 [Mollisia scopiformis]
MTRILHAQNLESPPPNSVELEMKGLELVWLPLQPNSLFEAVAHDFLEDMKPESSAMRGTLSASKAFEKFRPSPLDCSLADDTSINSPNGDAECELSEPEAGGEFSRTELEIVDSTIDNFDTSKSLSCGPKSDDEYAIEGDNYDAFESTREIGWTASDEEYVVEVDSDVAREFLGSQYSESLSSTPEEEKGALLDPHLPRILLDGEDILVEDSNESQLKATKTWPQLGREFKARHPELFPPSRQPMFQVELENYDSDADLECSFKSESRICSSQYPTPQCTTKLLPSSDLGVVKKSKCLQAEPFQVSKADIHANIVGDSSNDMPLVEHIEYAYGNQHGILDSSEVSQGMSQTPINIAGIEDGSKTSVPSLHVLFDLENGRRHNKEDPPVLEQNPEWSSWVEAEVAQRRMFQTDTLGREQIRLAPPEMRSKYGSLKKRGKFEQCYAQADELNEASSATCSQTRSSSNTSFPGGFPFTKYSESMLRKSSQMSSNSGPDKDVQVEKIVEGSSESTELKDTTVIEPEKQTENLATLEHDICSQVEPHEATPGEPGAANKSDLLEAVMMASNQSLDLVTPEDLNIRLVGKAARQSQLGKGSKVSSLIDLFKAHGLMSESAMPALHRQTTSPGIPMPPGRTTTPRSIQSPSKKNVGVGTEIASHSTNSLKRVPTYVSGLSDADTELDPGFGEELARCRKR